MYPKFGAERVVPSYSVKDMVTTSFFSFYFTCIPKLAPPVCILNWTTSFHNNLYATNHELKIGMNNVKARV